MYLKKVIKSLICSCYEKTINTVENHLWYYFIPTHRRADFSELENKLSKIRKKPITIKMTASLMWRCLAWYENEDVSKNIEQTCFIHLPVNFHETPRLHI